MSDPTVDRIVKKLYGDDEEDSAPEPAPNGCCHPPADHDAHAAHTDGTGTREALAEEWEATAATLNDAADMVGNEGLAVAETLEACAAKLRAAALAPEVARIEAEAWERIVAVIDDALCDALMAAHHGKYDGLDVETHLKLLIERVRQEVSDAPGGESPTG